MRIRLLGDTHGDGQWVNYVQHRAKQDGQSAIFQLGDFGIWHGMRGEDFLQQVSDQAVKLEQPFYFLDGNHENFVLLNELVRNGKSNETGHIEIAPNVFYSPRGHRWEWEGIKFMSFGGAVSVDKAYRREGSSWWPEEEITDEQVAAVEEDKVDVLLSHDCPFNPLSPYDRNAKWDQMSMPNQDRLRQVCDKVSPDWLVHGHFHIYHSRQWRGTNVIGLNVQWTDKSEMNLKLPSMDFEVF